MPLERRKKRKPDYDVVDDVVDPWEVDPVKHPAAEAIERDLAKHDAVPPELTVNKWGDVPREPFFGLDRTVDVMRTRYELTRWLRLRWWLARKIEWLACLVGGDRWCP